MHLVYSALCPTNKPSAQAERLDGYQAACLKHRDTIAAIQQYIPGWQPPLHQANTTASLKTCNQ